MASTKVVLRTTFSDEFHVGDVVITPEGTEIATRKQADEILEAARVSHVQVYEVPAEETPTKQNEGSGS
jgi:hypothetical protein